MKTDFYFKPRTKQAWEKGRGEVMLLSREIFGSDKKDKNLYYFATGPKGLSCVKWKEKCLVVLGKDKKEHEFYFDEIKPELYRTVIDLPENG